MKRYRDFLFNLLRDDSGQDLIEYALIAGLIGLASVTAMTSLATDISTAFGNIGTQLTGAGGG